MNSAKATDNATQSCPVEEHKLPPLRILCVEDDRSYFLLIRQYLLRAPFERPVEIVHFTTVSEAVACLRAEGDGTAFDVVMLDLNLPDSAGSETFERIHGTAPDVPVIILTGSDDNAMAVAMVQRGAQDYVPKDNLTGELLCRSILYALERNRLRCHLTRLNARLLKTTEDLRTAQMQLIEAEKLESLRRITASVAHEIKNPLNIIQMGIAFFDGQRAELGETASVVIDSMQEGIDRASRSVNAMLAFSPAESEEMAPCSVNQLLHNVLQTLQTELAEHRITLVEELAPSLPDVRVAASKISQVVVNLIMNAAQAMAGGGPIEIRSSLARVTNAQREAGFREFDRFRDGDPVVVIEIRDHGPGIPEELMSRIFEPFFTTKPTGEGAGLGLSLSKKIVELHRGRLEISNVTNPRGLCARIYLKAVSENCLV